MLKLYNGKTYDFDKEPSDTIQNAYDAKVEFDKGYMLTFKVVIDDKGLHKKIKNEMIVVCKGGYKNQENAFRIKERLEFGTYVEFKCPHLFYDLDHKRTKVPSGLFTANDILDFVQQNTEDLGNFKFKHDYIFGDAKFEFGNYKELKDKKAGEKVEPKIEYYNTLELMNKIFTEYDCEFMFDFWTINVYNKLGEDKESLIYEYKNIEDWEGIHSMEGKATRVIAQSDFERTTTYKTKYPNQKLYIHFAYGNDNKGKDFTNTNYQSRKYIGYYVDTKYENSPNAKDYKWVSMKIPKKTKKKPAFKGNRKVKGITSFMVGTDYRDGIPIKLNKKTFYLHTAFANYLDGKDININDGKGAKYVGFMINNKKDNTRTKEWFTFNLLTEKGGLLINDRRTLKEKVHLETIVESPLINNYAQIYTDTYVNNEARTVEELSQKVLDLFDEGWDKPKRTIKCKVKLTNNDNRHRLTTLGDYLYLADNDPCDLYDTVILRYITHDVDERIKCIGFEYDPINENLEMLKFGSKEKNDTISSSVTSGVKAEIERNKTDLDKQFEERNREIDEEIRKNKEEFNHIWLSEKIDFINSFNEYGEYFEDFQSELDRIDEERKQRAEELDKRLAENDELLKTTKESLIENTNKAINVATEELNRIDKELITISNNVVDLDKKKADLNEVYTKKDVDFKVDELNNSITSEVTNTVYSKVNASINSQEYINKLKGANGSNFTWNLLKKSNVVVENANYLIAKYDLAEKPVVGETYTCTIWGSLGKGKTKFGVFNSSGSIYLGYMDNIKDGVYQRTFKWANSAKLSDGSIFKANDTQLWVYSLYRNVTGVTSTIDRIKLEKGANTNPEWSPHVSEINGKDGTFEGEIGGRNLIKNSDDLSGCFVKFDGGNHKITDEEITEFGFGGKRLVSEAGNQTDGTKEIMLLDSENLIGGKIYTFSMYVKNNRDVPMRLNVKSIECDLIELKPNESKRLVVTGKKIDDTYANGKFRVFFNANTKNYYIDCTVSRPQLEEGDVATSWSKNPSDVENNLNIVQKEQSEIKQTVNSINSKITKTQSDLKQYSNLSQKVDSMSSTVAQIEPLKLSHAKLEQKVNSFSSNLVEISNNTKKISSLTQTVNGLSSTVSSLSDGLDSKIGSIIEQKKNTITLGIGNITGLQKNLDSLKSSITVSEKSITAKADKVDLQGKVSFRDLNSENYDNHNSTFIDGGKIMTDTIEARQIKVGSIQSFHLKVDDAMINKLVTNTILTQKIVGSQANINVIKSTDISASRITTGLLKSKDGSSWIDLANGNFSFYHNSLFVDENQMDYSSGTKRTRLHTTGTFRVSYGDNPSVELNSGGITLFKSKAGQDSKGTNKIQSNSNGNVQIGTVAGNGSTNTNVEIGSKNGYVMHIYGSLYVGRNLMVDQAIRYGASCQKGTSF